MFHENVDNKLFEMNKLFDYLLHNQSALGIAILHRLSFIFPDKQYLKMMFRLKMGYPLNLRKPQTFNEKLQWLKLYNRRQEYTQMVDKYEVKEYVAKVIGEEYIIPTIGVWDKFDQIDFSSLPEQFVLKTTHGGGGSGIVICNNRDNFDISEAKQILNRSLSGNIYKSLREWPYRGVKKRIIAEQYIQDECGELKDYKFFCFNGVVKFFKIDFGRFSSHHANYYDRKGTLLPFGEADYMPCPNKVIDMPHNLSEMIALAEKLSRLIPFLRVDLYNVNGTIYFGELTFFPASGFGKISPENYDYIIGKSLELPELWSQRQ